MELDGAGSFTTETFPLGFLDVDYAEASAIAAAWTSRSRSKEDE
jgi:hypothetical protein